jgi:hypothetical membrane protein
MADGWSRRSGILFVLAGSVILMGIITAEALYPAIYTTTDNEISDLGATRPPSSIILQPSSTIFNLTMVVSGMLLVVAAYGVHRAFARRFLSVAAMVLGVGVLGVGVFPGNYGDVHPWFALFAFIGGGLAAIASATVVGAPLRWLSLALGSVALVFLFGSEFFIDHLGDGGTERWVAYPVVLWMLAFGGYLLGREES